jgi:hypothetical protein
MLDSRAKPLEGLGLHFAIELVGCIVETAALTIGNAGFLVAGLDLLKRLVYAV